MPRAENQRPSVPAGVMAGTGRASGSALAQDVGEGGKEAHVGVFGRDALAAHALQFELYVGAEQLAQFGVDAGAVLAGQDADVEAQAHFRGDDVALVAALDDGGVEGVVQQGLEPAAGVAQLVEDGVGLRGVEQAQQLRAFVGGQGFGEGLDHQAHAGGDVHWQAAPVEDLQGAAELGHGAAAQGHGAVSAGAAEDDLGAAAGLSEIWIG